jgi:hypothetical protein
MALKKMLMLLSMLLIWSSMGWISSTYILEFSGVLGSSVRGFHELRLATIIIGIALLFLSTILYMASRFLREEKKRIGKYIFCKTCGKRILFDVVICPYCLTAVKEEKMN